MRNIPRTHLSRVEASAWDQTIDWLAEFLVIEMDGLLHCQVQKYTRDDVVSLLDELLAS